MGSSGRGVQVLVVEDDRELREEMCDLLAFEGYAPIGCGDVRAAWTQLTGGLRPAVIVTDLGLPGLSGREFVKLIREQAWGQQMPVLLLSAWENANRLGVPADTVLVKGGEPEALARAVDRLARWQEAPRQAAAEEPRHAAHRARNGQDTAGRQPKATPLRRATAR